MAYAAEARGVVGEGAEEKVRVAEPSAPTKMKRLPGRQGAKAIADSAAGFIEQLLAEASKKPGKRPSEFKAGEQRYGRGTGKEAAAVVSRAEVLVEKREYLSTAQGFEVLTPTFITLMHELGHALKIAIGGYMPDDEDLMSHFVSHLPALQQRWWAALKGRPNMLEELVNILGIEKPVREESGLAPREIYQATREVKVDAAREKLRAVMGRDPDDSAYMDDIIGPLYAKITPSISLTDVEQLLTDIDAITPAVQARAKADYAQTLKTDLEGFLHDEPDNQRRVRRTRRYQALHAQLEHIVRNPDITAIQLQGLPQKLQALKDDKALLVKAGMLIKSFQTGGFRSKFAKRVHEGGDIRDYVPT